MKLSVIIPVYNSEKYLEKCLNSVLNQNYKDLEVIIINDGSPDNSEKIIKDFQKKYSNIIYIKQENAGQAHSRNVGIKESTGSLITFVDSDDYILPNMYSKMIAKMVEEKSDMVICDMYLEKNGTKIVANCTTFDNLYESSASVCNKIFKKELISNERFLEGIWYEDYNFFIKVCLKNPTYSIVKIPFYNYVLHEKSTMHNDNALKNLDIITATDDILKLKIEQDNKETIIINHILQDAINRVYNQKSQNKRKVLKELREYVHKHIKKLSKTKVYQKSSLKRKIILQLNYHNMGYISSLLLKLKRRVK